MIYVIGSGPAGVACASALLKRGLTVTMLDVGVELEKEGKDKLLQLKNRWDATLIESLKHDINTKDNVKLSYGSHYVYNEVDHHITLQCDEHVYCKPSFSKGGLSNIWGAFIDCYTDEEMQGWPISLAQLKPYYQTVLNFIPASHNPDDKAVNPLFIKHNTYQPSKQANYLLSHFNKHHDLLTENSISYGSSTLAVNFTTQQQACTYCGLCQHGCPYELIYSSRHTLERLLNSHKKFSYINNVVVNKVDEINNEIIIYGHKANDKAEAINFHGSQVFVACGSILSTKILLTSLFPKNTQAKLLDSQHFMVPCITLKRIKDVQKEKLFTLCQLYLRINNKTLSNPAHLQIYTYMDHYDKKLKSDTKFLYPFIKPFIKLFLERLLIIQGLLHSTDSHSFNLQVTDDNGKNIKLTAVHNPATTKNIKTIMKAIFKNRKILGLIPLTFLAKTSKIARSYHYGGSFPMATTPSNFNTDIWGRPVNRQRTHVVDASIFPTIPANAITLTIMANAYRIGSECKIYEES